MGKCDRLVDKRDSYSRIRLSSLREIDSPTRDIVSSVSSVTQGDCGDAGVCAC